MNVSMNINEETSYRITFYHAQEVNDPSLNNKKGVTTC